MSKSSSIRSLNVKFLAILLPSISLTALIIFAFYALVKWQFVETDLHEAIEQMAAIHRNAIAYPLSKLDFDELERSLATLALNPEIVCVEIHSHQDPPIHRWSANCNPDSHTHSSAVNAVLRKPPGPVSSMELHYTQALAFDILKRDLVVRGLFFVLFVTVGAFLSYGILHWYVNRPLAKLMASIRKAEQENIREPVEWSSNDELGAVITAYNGMLRQIDENTQELVTAREQAESAATTKNRFLAGMSHELRTPLNAVIGITEMLREDAEDREEDTEPYERISGSGRHLLQLIDHILDFSKIEAGKVELVMEEVELLELLDDAVATARSLADEHSNNLTLEFNGDPATLLTDPLRLRQILINLLGNACKFTENGNVVLSVFSQSGSGEQRVHFCVSDTGIGIAEDRRKHLFKDFSQADSSTTRKYGGTGLGLAISQRLCHLLGGKITVESSVGDGSQFSFDLPV